MATFLSFFVFKKDTRHIELVEIKLQPLRLHPAKRKQLLYLKIRLLIILAMLNCLSSSSN